MKQWFLKLYNDPVFFESFVRAIIKGTGALAFSGMLPAGNTGWWIGLFALAFGGEIPVVRKPNGNGAPAAPAPV